jgi:hypothetical protein
MMMMMMMMIAPADPYLLQPWLAAPDLATCTIAIAATPARRATMAQQLSSRARWCFTSHVTAPAAAPRPSAATHRPRAQQPRRCSAAGEEPRDSYVTELMDLVRARARACVTGLGTATHLRHTVQRSATRPGPCRRPGCRAPGWCWTTRTRRTRGTTCWTTWRTRGCASQRRCQPCRRCLSWRRPPCMAGPPAAAAAAAAAAVVRARGRQAPAAAVASAPRRRPHTRRARRLLRRSRWCWPSCGACSRSGGRRWCCWMCGRRRSSQQGAWPAGARCPPAAALPSGSCRAGDVAAGARCLSPGSTRAALPGSCYSCCRHLEGGVNVPIEQLDRAAVDGCLQRAGGSGGGSSAAESGGPAASSLVVVVGSGDHRSAQACVRLTRVYGLAEVRHLEGGWQERLREQQA